MIRVISAGLYTTVQDLGRFGFQKYGVPVSGAMDRYSAVLANKLLNNNKNDAVLEITAKGPTLQFQISVEICITGANLSPKLNDIRIDLNKPISIKADDILRFGKPIFGIRSYLAVSGGFQTDIVMDSRSMYNGITKKQILVKNEMLKVGTKIQNRPSSNTQLNLKKHHFGSNKIEVYKGPEFEQLKECERQKLLSQKFTVSKENNRMAYQLLEPIKNTLKPIITSLVMPGTIQMTPDGKLIVLMRDCQTTGGYPRVLQLSEAAIDIMAQKFTNDSIKFELVDL